MLAHALMLMLSQAPEVPPPPPPSAISPTEAPTPPPGEPAIAAPPPPPPPPVLDAPPPPPPGQPRLLISPEHHALLARRTLLEDEMPNIRGPMWMMVGSAGLGFASVWSSIQFAQQGGFVALSQNPDPWMGITQVVTMFIAGAAHVFLGILGTVNMNKRIKARHAQQQQLAEVEAQLSRMPHLPPNLVPTL